MRWIPAVGSCGSLISPAKTAASAGSSSILAEMRRRVEKGLVSPLFSEVSTLTSYQHNVVCNFSQGKPHPFVVIRASIVMKSYLVDETWACAFLSLSLLVLRIRSSRVEEVKKIPLQKLQSGKNAPAQQTNTRSRQLVGLDKLKGHSCCSTKSIPQT